MSIAEKLTQIAENEPKVYEAGKKAQHNEFWDNFNYSGRNCFAGQGWNKETFKPTKDFYVQQGTFYYHNWLGTAYDLAAQLEEQGVTMRMGSNARREGFYYAWFTRLPILDFSERSGSMSSTFYGDSQLVTIDKIILPTEGNITSFDSTFSGCSKLKNITFEGVIDRSISFSACPLSVESMKSIISCLKDYSTEAPFTYTLTLSDSCKTALEADTEKVDEHSNYTYWEWITVKVWSLA